MRAVWLPPVDGERKQQLPDDAEPVQDVPAIAEKVARGPSPTTSWELVEERQQAVNVMVSLQ